MEKQDKQEKEIKRELSQFDKIFIAELIQDIPLWLSIVMGLYKSLQNEYIYFLSLIIGGLASIYIIQKIKEGVYSPGTIAENPNEVFTFTIYTFAILIVLIIGSWKEILYMESYTWIYLIVFSALELIFYLKQINKKE
ncbi:MAG TPA: hypothetical protein EYH43_00725 [Persephonella sp.]|nr:hypothetical protein [Hydrogenothermaceae bacterium]HIQ24493.1 hypothetical protein [Persephonella sp.]